MPKSTKISAVIRDKDGVIVRTFESYNNALKHVEALHSQGKGFHYVRKI